MPGKIQDPIGTRPSGRIFGLVISSRSWTMSRSRLISSYVPRPRRRMWRSLRRRTLMERPISSRETHALPLLTSALLPIVFPIHSLSIVIDRTRTCTGSMPLFLARRKSSRWICKQFSFVARYSGTQTGSLVSFFSPALTPRSYLILVVRPVSGVEWRGRSTHRSWRI
ncbi:hypothetical protein BDR07DRAFT_928568 [Suillus spraguei]|nr:hypothetical protein BDR07DRAFT_928568 [Suillus spraguei]